MTTTDGPELEKEYKKASKDLFNSVDLLSKIRRELDKRLLNHSITPEEYQYLFNLYRVKMKKNADILWGISAKYSQYLKENKDKKVKA